MKDEDMAELLDEIVHSEDPETTVNCIKSLVIELLQSGIRLRLKLC